MATVPSASSAPASECRRYRLVIMSSFPATGSVQDRLPAPVRRSANAAHDYVSTCSLHLVSTVTLFVRLKVDTTAAAALGLLRHSRLIRRLLRRFRLRRHPLLHFVDRPLQLWVGALRQQRRVFVDDDVGIDA